MKNSDDLIIWLKDGQTMRFQKVSGFTASDYCLSFGYEGVSTRMARAATFFLKDIAGYALNK